MKKSLSEINFAGYKRATVLNNVDSLGEGRIAVVISEVSPNKREYDTPTALNTKEPLQKNVIENKEDNPFNSNIQVVNFYWIRPTNHLNTLSQDKSVDEPISKLSKPATHQTIKTKDNLSLSTYNASSGEYKVPKIGSTVWVYFEDEDPQKGYYLPFSPTLDGQVTPMTSVESKDNVNSMERKVNLDIIREFRNGNVIYADTNEDPGDPTKDKNNFVIKFKNGHRIKIEHNNNGSSIVIDTEGGHEIKLVDKSSKFGKDNPLDKNDIDGKNKGKYVQIKTSKGHFAVLDDNDGKEKIMLETVLGHQVNMDDVKQSVLVTASNGAQMYIDGAADNIGVQTAGGASLNLYQGNDVTINCAAKIHLTSQAEIMIDAPIIKLNPSGSGSAMIPPLSPGTKGSIK